MIFFEKQEGIASSSVPVASFSDIYRADRNGTCCERSHLICKDRNSNNLVQRGSVERSRRTGMRESVFTGLKRLTSKSKARMVIQS